MIDATERGLRTGPAVRHDPLSAAGAARERDAPERPRTRRMFGMAANLRIDLVRHLRNCNGTLKSRWC